MCLTHIALQPLPLSKKISSSPSSKSFVFSQSRMRSLRGSLASIPGALSEFISNTTTTPIDGASQVTIPSPPPFSVMTSSAYSDDFSDVSHAIPSTLIKEQWQVILDQDASVDELKSAIERCKELVVSTDELSDERKWLVRHLVELRFRLSEIEDALGDSGMTGSNVRVCFESCAPSAFELMKIPKLSQNSIFEQVILGHHFVDSNSKATPKTRQHCDHCTGVIWSVVQASYICSDCNYRVHHKCVNSVSRICAHITASEYKEPIGDICPEDGLAAQKYKCSECESSLSFSKYCVLDTAKLLSGKLAISYEVNMNLPFNHNHIYHIHFIDLPRPFYYFGYEYRTSGR